MRLVVLPQLIRIALPGLANLWLILLKDTALVSAIGLTDILRRTGIAARVEREPFLFFGFADPDLPRAGDHFVLRDQHDRALGRPAGAGAMSAAGRTAVELPPPPPPRGWPRERIVGYASGRLLDPGRHRPARLSDRRLEPRMVREIRPGLHLRPERDAGAGRHLDRPRRHPVAADRLCPDVEEHDPVGPRLCLRLFLPRHAAARADLPDLLRRRLVPAAARGDRPVVVLPRSLVLRDPGLLAEHRRLSGRNPARRDRERSAGASGKAPPRSACTSCRRCGRSSCRRR